MLQTGGVAAERWVAADRGRPALAKALVILAGLARAGVFTSSRGG